MSFIKIKALEVEEGAGAKVRRLFPAETIRNFDPFVLFDHFSISPPAGFPQHPHRGFEIITLVIEGALKHTDSIGNSEVIKGLGIQRITVGRGIFHSEMPASEGITRGIQLWINLPRKLKSIPPFYQNLDSQSIQARRDEGLTEYLIAGKGTKIQMTTPVEYRFLKMEEGTSFKWEPEKESNTILYVIEGEALLSCRGTGLSIRAKAVSSLVVVSGMPIGEPIIQRGPFVD